MSLLDVVDVHKSFGAVQAVAGVDLQLESGQILALIGPNGAGKSTLFNLIGGQLSPDRGQVRFQGRSLAGMAERDIWRLGLARTFQVAQTFASFSVLENLQIVLLSHARQSLGLWQRAKRFQTEQAYALLERVAIAHLAGRLAGQLSYGDVKRLELALALASEPRLLLMDEPTAGMAPEQRQQLMDLVRQLARRRQLAVFFTEHSMDVVFGYADQVMVLANGKLLAQGSPAQVRSDPRVQQIYLGAPSLAASSA